MSQVRFKMKGKNMKKWEKEIHNKALCLSGRCDHKMNSNVCLYTRLLDAADGDWELYKQIMKLVETAIKETKKECR